MPCFTYEAQWSTYYLPGIPTGKQCPGATRTQFACWGASPIPENSPACWLRICKMLLCRPKTKPFSTLTEFAIFEKSIAYGCRYMV